MLRKLWLERDEQLEGSFGFTVANVGSGELPLGHRKLRVAGRDRFFELGARGIETSERPKLVTHRHRKQPRLVGIKVSPGGERRTRSRGARRYSKCGRPLDENGSGGIDEIASDFIAAAHHAREREQPDQRLGCQLSGRDQLLLQHRFAIDEPEAERKTRQHLSDL